MVDGTRSGRPGIFGIGAAGAGAGAPAGAVLGVVAGFGAAGVGEGAAGAGWPGVDGRGGVFMARRLTARGRGRFRFANFLRAEA